MLRLPSSIKILGTPYRIVTGGVCKDECDKCGGAVEDHECFGETVRLGRTIHLYDKALRSGDAEVLATLIHESVHAAFEVGGLSGEHLPGQLEEALCTVLENHIIQQLPLWSRLYSKLPRRTRRRRS